MESSLLPNSVPNSDWAEFTDVIFIICDLSCVRHFVYSYFLFTAHVFGLVVTCARNFLCVFRQLFMNAVSAFCMYNCMLLILSLFLFTQFGRLKWTWRGSNIFLGWLWIDVQRLIISILMLLADRDAGLLNLNYARRHQASSNCVVSD